jgi:hypothetical protein
MGRIHRNGEAGVVTISPPWVQTSGCPSDQADVISETDDKGSRVLLREKLKAGLHEKESLEKKSAKLKRELYAAI